MAERPGKVNAPVNPPVSHSNTRRLDIEGGAARVKYFGVGDLTVATRITAPVNTGLYFTHGDHQGSLQVLTNAAGDVVQRLSYQPFGETSRSGSVDFVSRRYTGQIADPETGLYFYNTRGRWVRRNRTSASPPRYPPAMPRQARLDAPDTLHHVRGRGWERRSIFRDAADRADFLARRAGVAGAGAPSVYDPPDLARDRYRRQP